MSKRFIKSLPGSNRGYSTLQHTSRKTDIPRWLTRDFVEIDLWLRPLKSAFDSLS